MIEELEQVKEDVEATIAEDLHEPIEQTGRNPLGLRFVVFMLVMIAALIFAGYLILFSASNEVTDSATPTTPPTVETIPAT